MTTYGIYMPFTSEVIPERWADRAVAERACFAGNVVVALPDQFDPVIPPKPKDPTFNVAFKTDKLAGTVSMRARDEEFARDYVRNYLGLRPTNITSVSKVA